MTEGTTLLVLVHEGAPAGAVVAVARLACDHEAVTGCAVSVPDDAESGRQDLLLEGLLELGVVPQRVGDVTARLAASLDPHGHSVLEVERRGVIEYDRDWPLGQRTPGERVVTMAVRKPPLSREEFDAYWRDVHTGVALSYAVPPWGYVQFVTRRRLFGDRPEPDGVLVMSFRSAADRIARYEQHPDDAARGAADAAVFMDLTRTGSVLMHETIYR